MDPTEESMGGAREDGGDKRIKLKRIKKKKSKFDLNLSTNNKMSFSARMNITAANSSVVKASLRANNKALAQSLEKVRQDLRVSYEVNNDMKKEFQDLQLRLMNLERVAGLKDDSLEKEVQRRIEDKTQQLKYILSKVSVHLLDAGSCLQDALDKCMDPSRMSLASSARNSSLGASDDAYSPINSGATSSIYYNPNTFSRVSVSHPQPVQTVDPAPMETDALQQQGVDTVRQVQEMTMILEQSVLAEGNLHDDCEDLPAVSEGPVLTETESKEAVSSSISDKVSPKYVIEESQRSGRSKSRQKAVSSSNGDLIKSPEVLNVNTSELKRDRRGTFVVPPPKPQPEAEPEDRCKQDRRGTFVVKKPVPESKEKPKKDSKRETFVLSRSPALPDQSVKPVMVEQEDVFKVPLPVCDPDDVTVYLNSDMELTEVINVEQIAVAKQADMPPHEDENPKSEVKEKTKTVDKKPTQTVEKSKSKIAKSTSLTSISAKEKKDIKLSKSDSDVSKESEESSKPAVVLQLRKPGKIVFTASRRDFDGSRKAIPSKLPSRPRTKSKKEIKDMKDSIATNFPSPKNIFDFHDKTPVHLAEKSRVQPSVYDISINDSNVQPSVEQPNKKENQLKGETAKKDAQKCDSVSVTYSMPLKGSPDEKKLGARSRSRSRGPTSRSKSRSRKPTSDTEVEGESDKEESGLKGSRSKGRRGRSHSRARKEDANEEEMDVDDSDEKCNDRGRSRSRGLMTRSRSQSRKRQPADEDVEMNDEHEEKTPNQNQNEKDGLGVEKIQKTGRGKSQSDSDDVTEGEDAQMMNTEAGEILEKTHRKLKSSKLANNDTELTQSVSEIDSSKFVSSRNGRSKKRKPENQTEDSAKHNENEPDKPKLGDKSKESLAVESRDTDPECIQPLGRASRTAKTKANNINKIQAAVCSDDEDQSVTDGKKAVEAGDDLQDDWTAMDDSLTMVGDLQPVSSRDFIAKLISIKPVVKTSKEDMVDSEEIQPVRKSSRSLVRRQRIPSDSDDEVIPPTQSKVDDGKKSLVSTTDEEAEDDDIGNKTKVVPATDDEGNSEEDAFTKKIAKSEKKKETVKAENMGQDKSRSRKLTKEDAAASADERQLPQKGKPEVSRGRPKEIKKVERQCTQSKKKVDVKELLQAFTEFDDPDHSLRLNATCRNDSVVIAESIKNYSPTTDQSAKHFVPLDEMEDPGDEEEVYHLPLKDSPNECGKGKARGQSRSKGRSRSKKRTDSEDFELKCSSKEGKRDKVDGCKNIESGTYSLPLKASPEENKRKESRSRSKSRSRAERSCSQRKNYIEVDSQDEDEEQSEVSSSISNSKNDEGKNVENGASPLKGSTDDTKRKDSRSPSRSELRMEKGQSRSSNHNEAACGDEDEIQFKETSIHSWDAEPTDKTESETYSIPLKGSPEVTKKKDSRSRSKSRSRVGKGHSQRKKHTEADSGDEVDIQLQKSSRSSDSKGDKQKKNEEENGTYTLQVKGSPDEPKEKNSRSRSRVRKGQHKKYVEASSDDEEEVPDEESSGHSGKGEQLSGKSQSEICNRTESETYSLPLKGSQGEPKKKDSRSRSKSRSRVERGRSQRKKYTEADSDEDDIQLEESSAKADPPSNKSQSETYSLPLKGSPEVPKKKDSRSRSKSRSQVERGRSQRKKYTEADSDEDDIQLEESSAKADPPSNKSQSETYSLPLKGSPEVPKKKDSRSRSKSRSRVEKGRSQSKKHAVYEEATPDRNKGNDSKSQSRRESLQITVDAEQSTDSGKRSVKKLHKRKSDEEISQTPSEEKTNKDNKTNPSSEIKSAKSTGKKSAKKKLEVTADKPARSKESQQAELKVMFNELKRKLSMLPNPTERMSLYDLARRDREGERRSEEEERI
ncbi:serine/arginine repetitive matrix protein 2-like [Haliotis rubra]|uniref:serine/arginine repetitive matrix protein 2-like n=1 Tax=Haliotis rubra TaxID=36100 RepID=UPI001EE56E87|nr:serine/arginine repetitive matrix protein 2-like [Haliotis rubra]XP_046568408.1 serine/arginine repetitive matrix protein 2-like [Haliotis rubra]